MPILRNLYTGQSIYVPIDAPTLTPAPSLEGTWVLLEQRAPVIDPQSGITHTRVRQFYSRQAPQAFPTEPLYPLEPNDPRIAELQAGRPVTLPSPTFLLCQPHIGSTPHRARGVVAVSFAGGAAWKEGAPELWIDGEPFGFLRTLDYSVYPWIQRAADDSLPTCWFTTDGRTLWRLVAGARVPEGLVASGRLVIEIERVA